MLNGLSLQIPTMKIVMSADMDDEDALIPVIALMPDGYMEPRAEMILTFESSPITFKYRWDEETAAMTMLRIAQ